MTLNAASHPDPDLLARWLAITGLIAGADQLAARRSWPSTALALASAMAAAEAILGLLATSGGRPPSDKVLFEDLLNLAAEALRDRGKDLEPGLRARLIRTQRQRNLAMHVGTDPSPQGAARAVQTVKELRDLAVSLSDELSAFGANGPVRAVARMVGIPGIGDQLVAAADALEEHRMTDALDAAAMALDVALSRVTPPLRPPASSAISRLQFEAEHDDILHGLEERSDRLEAWLLALALGLSPAVLARLQRTLGAVTWWGGAVARAEVSRRPNVDTSPSTTTDAILEVADIIFRLWQDDALRRGDTWDDNAGR